MIFFAKSATVFFVFLSYPTAADDQKKGFTIVVVDGEEDSPTDSSGVRRLSYRRLLARCAPLDLSEAEDFDFDVDPVALPFSSGTTGPPKGVELTHRNLVANGRQLVYGEGFDFLPFPTESLQVTTICVLPMFHIFGLNVVSFPGLHMGEQVVMMPGFDPAAFAQALQDVKVEWKAPFFFYLHSPFLPVCFAALLSLSGAPAGRLLRQPPDGDAGAPGALQERLRRRGAGRGGAHREVQAEGAPHDFQRR